MNIILEANYLIQFGLCVTKIFNHYFNNNKTGTYEKFLYPKINVTYNFTEKIISEYIVFANVLIINEIAELKIEKKVHFTILITAIVIMLIMILSLLVVCKRAINIKQTRKF